MLNELKYSLDERQINVIFDGIATRMAGDLPAGEADETFEHRLDRVVVHLTAHGYNAHWEHSAEGYVLHTNNCPYSGVVEQHGDLCGLDLRYISELLGTVPRRIAHMVDGAESCSYLVTSPQGALA
jgi:predicted ArsR family transcriptional regulator